MANQLVDDMSADPVPGTLEPAQTSAEALEHTQSLASSSPAVASRAENARGRARTGEPRANKRSPRPEAHRDAGKPASSAKPPSAKANEARPASERTSGLDRTVEPSSTPATLKAPVADPAVDPVLDSEARGSGTQAPEPDGDAKASRAPLTAAGGPAEPVEPASKPDANGNAAQPDVNGSSEAHGTVLRRGLPRAGVYRPSSGTRSPRSTPVAVTAVVAPIADPPPADSQPPGEVGEIAIAAQAGPVAIERAAPLSPSLEPPAEPSTVPSVPRQALVEPTVADPRPPGTEATSAEAASAETASARKAGIDTGASSGNRRRARIGIGVIGAAVIGAAIVVVAIGLSSGEARRLPPASLGPAAASLHTAPPPALPPPSASEHLMPAPAPRTAEFPAAPLPAAEVAAQPATALAPAKPPLPRATEAAPPRSGSPPPEPAQLRANVDASSPARGDSTREPARVAKPATQPRTAPAKRLTYDPNALFLQQP